MIRQKIPQTYTSKCQSLKVPPWQLWKHRTWLLHGRVTFVKSCGSDYTADGTVTVSLAPKDRHWEGPSVPIIWRMHHLVSHLSITQCPTTQRRRTSPDSVGALHHCNLWAPCHAGIASLRSESFSLPPSAQTGGQVPPQVLGLIGSGQGYGW